MDEAIPGRKPDTSEPDGEAPVGAKEPSANTSEAGGRGTGFLYTCYQDGAGNYFDRPYGRFTCWRCGSVNYT